MRKKATFDKAVSYNISELTKKHAATGRVMDDASSTRYFTPEKISPNQELTPEGFLLCKGVPIARTGVMYYGPEEVPIEQGRDEYISIYRDAEQVFRPETIASFIGKPVTNDHPPEHVDPDNFKKYTEGFVAHAYRGDGINDKYIMADLLIMGKDAIADIKAGKREVSAGYDANYEQLQPGSGRQTNIIGNHVALVKRGRCGSTCAIADRSNEMTAKRQTWFDCVRAAFKNSDEAALEKILKDAAAESPAAGDDKNIHLHVYPNQTNDEEKEDEVKDQKATDDAMEARMKRMEDAILAIAKDRKAKDADEEEKEDKETDDEDEEEKEDKKETGDAAKHFRLWQDTASRAELIVPGFRMPTFDTAEKSSAKFKDALCASKRKVLDKAYETEQGRSFIEPLLNGKAPTFDKMPCSALDALFVSVSEMFRVANTRRSEKTHDGAKPTIDAFAKGGIDKINQSFWATRNSK